MPYKDLETRRQARRRYYQNNREALRDLDRKNKANYREWLLSIKSQMACSRCGENHPACLDFHHPDPATKSFGIGDTSGSGRSQRRVLKEISKCIVLCANCHRKLHHEDRD